MTHIITANNGAGSTSPTAIEGYEPSRASRNIITDLLDGSLGVAFIPPRPRAGTLRLFYLNRADALESYELHAEPTSFTLTSSVSDAGMTYALEGSLDWDQDVTTGEWWVLVGYQELS